MPLIDVQRRMAETGAIRIGNRVLTGGTDRKGNPKSRPNKLDTFRVTSPYKHVIEAVARDHGGTVAEWRHPTGMQYEVITSVRELPVLIPQQVIDPNYEMWGNKYRDRLCDGQTERIRRAPCLCMRWDNHSHYWYKGACQTCGLSESWEGAPHEHRYVDGFCETCGCHRPCKPTTRVSAMIRNIPAGIFKFESHGLGAASELPGFSDMIASTPIALPAILGMVFVDSIKLVIKNGREVMETRQYWKPQLQFPWLLPDMAFAEASQLESTVRAQLSISLPTRTNQAAISSAPETPPTEPEDEDQTPALTEADILRLAEKCVNIPQLQQLWWDAKADNVLTDTVTAALNRKSKDLSPKSDDHQVTETVDAEIIDDGWPVVAEPAQPAT